MCPPEPPYRPIDCGFYDRIEQAAVRGTEIPLAYLNPDGAEVGTRARVADVYSRAGAEYLRLDSGAEVRLDRVLALDGIPRPVARTDGTCAPASGEI